MLDQYKPLSALLASDESFPKNSGFNFCLAPAARNPYKASASNPFATGNIKLVSKDIQEMSKDFSTQAPSIKIPAEQVKISKAEENFNISLIDIQEDQMSKDSTQAPSIKSPAKEQVKISKEENFNISLKNIFDWNFDALAIEDNIMLCRAVVRLFDAMFDFSKLNIDRDNFVRYITEVCGMYHKVPFHCFQHAVAVTHMTYMLMTHTDAECILTLEQQFALLLSAVVHNVDHPGNTNTFEINSSSDLAIRYNDQSVLENHHCATAFRLIKKNSLFESMSESKAKEIRNFMIGCIMATDVTRHNKYVQLIRDKKYIGWNFDNQSDVSNYGELLLHAADLSNPVRPFHISDAWMKRIYAEFNKQALVERARGMPVLDFMVTKTAAEENKKELGFMSFVVAPMWIDFCHCFPRTRHLVDQLKTNISLRRVRMKEDNGEAEEKGAKATREDTGDNTTFNGCGSCRCAISRASSSSA